MAACSCRSLCFLDGIVVASNAYSTEMEMEVATCIEKRVLHGTESMLFSEGLLLLLLLNNIH